MKIAIIGGGSTYSPPFVNELLKRRKDIPVDALAFMDTDEKRLNVVAGFIKRMLKKEGMSDLKVVATTNLRGAVADSDFVITTIRPGGNYLRAVDEGIAIKHGVLGEETVGAGGFAFALRAIPLSIEIAKEVQRSSSKALILNVTNPVTAIVEGMVRYSDAKVIGLMSFIWTQMAAKILDVDPKRVRIVHVGHKHFGWFLKIYVDGEELPDDQVVSKYLEYNSKLSPADRIDQQFIKDWRWPYIDLPIFFKYYFLTEEAYDYQVKKGKTRGQEVTELQKELLEYYERCNSLEEIPYRLFHRGSTEGERKEAGARMGFGAFMPGVIAVINAIVNDTNEYSCEALPNSGSIDGFDDKAVIRIPCILNKAGPHPLRLGKLPPEIDGILHLLKAHDLLTVEAAVKGSYELALKALMAHPLVRTYTKAKAVLDDLLEADKEYLPQFFKK